MIEAVLQNAPDNASLGRLDGLEHRAEVFKRIRAARRQELEREFDALGNP